MIGTQIQKKVVYLARDQKEETEDAPEGIDHVDELEGFGKERRGRIRELRWPGLVGVRCWCLEKEGKG